MFLRAFLADFIFKLNENEENIEIIYIFFASKKQEKQRRLLSLAHRRRAAPGQKASRPHWGNLGAPEARYAGTKATALMREEKEDAGRRFVLSHYKYYFCSNRSADIRSERIKKMEKDNRILFLDAEFVDNQEVIELSVWNHQGEEVYHEFFRPEEIDEWPVSENVHHISPADVADKPSFSSCKRKIQGIFDGADYIVGFATSGDVAHLKESGIKGLERKRIIDIKHIFWLYVGIEKEIDFYGIPGLSKVAEILEVSFGEKGAHSASEDTLVTLKCFNRLVEMIPDFTYDSRAEGSFEEAINRFEESFAVAKEEYERKKAHGWVHVFSTGDKGIYKLLFKKWEPEESEYLIGKMEVGDLSKAESEIISRFQRKMLQGRRGIFRFSKKDLSEVLSYSNEFGNEEEHNMSKKLLMLQKRYR